MPSSVAWLPGYRIVLRLLPAFLLVMALLALLALRAPLSAEPPAPSFQTDDAAYVSAVASGAVITPLLTVGEEVTRTHGGAGYRMIGIPDGLGAYEDDAGLLHLFVNHEVNNNTVTQPLVNGEPFTGSFISEYLLDPTTLEVVSGDLAFTTIYTSTQPTPVFGAFGRFCSGALGGEEYGFDGPIYFAGEEANGSGSFDGRGGVAVAVMDQAAYILPEFGHFSKENIVPVPGTGSQTVLLGLEDGPSGLESQLYLYVGSKVTGDPHPLRRNGLAGGSLYVLVSSDANHTDEASFHKGDGTIAATWVPLPDAMTMSESELEAEVQALGAFNFIRLEDGSAPVSNLGHFYFATTGSTNEANHKGRLYELTFNPDNVLAGAYLTVLLEGDAGDPVVNPDNLDINAHGMTLIQEDPNTEYRGAGLGRDSSIWQYDTHTGTLTRVAQIDQTSVPEAMRGEWGEWETSGIIDASAWLGPHTWLLDVQAHSISSAEASQLQGFAEDMGLSQGGQLLMLTTAAPQYQQFAPLVSVGAE